MILLYIVVLGILGFLLAGEVGILLGILSGILIDISIKLTEVIRLLRNLKDFEILKSKTRG